jgi:hypothetical protein
MLRLRHWSVLILTLVPSVALRAGDQPASPWSVDRVLTVSAQKAPLPALRYRLLPQSMDLKDGNAVPIYLRLVHQQSDAAQEHWTEMPSQWNQRPVNKLPVSEARKFLQQHAYLLRQLEFGARRRTAEWDYTLDAGNPIGLLLPDMQSMRSYVPMLILQARVALAEGDFPLAAHHLETGFAFARHIAQGPTLIHRMVAMAVASQLHNVVADFIELPGAPNLYWALTALPQPLIDLRSAEEWEYRMVEMQIPELGDLERARTPEQWDSALRRVRTELQQLAGLAEEGPATGSGKTATYFPMGWTPEQPAAQSSELVAARQFLTQRGGFPAEKVEAMSPAEVLLRYIMGGYAEDRDANYSAAWLPYPQAFPRLTTAHQRLRGLPASESHVLARIILPALSKVLSTQARVERSLAALRVIEALRQYAAAHDGQLPGQLTDVTELPLPDDPGTGHPFEYRREGDTARLVSQIPGDPQPSSGLRYRVTLRK